MKIILISFFVFILFIGNSQVYTYQNAKKFYYEIVSNENDSINKRIYQAAYDFNKYDKYRLLSDRRRIEITGYNAYLILFSANELLERYGKQISPLTIFGSDFQKVALFFTDNKFPEFSIEGSY
jgi:hypothetical protein